MAIRDDDASIAVCKQQLADALPMAVQVLKELATMGDKDSVRLAAAESIMERGGLPKKTEVVHTVDQSEHDRATDDARALVEGIERNKAALAAPDISLEAVIVHEGDTPDELPIAAPDTYSDVVDADSTEVSLPEQLADLDEITV